MKLSLSVLAASLAALVLATTTSPARADQADKDACVGLDEGTDCVRGDGDPGVCTPDESDPSVLTCDDGSGSSSSSDDDSSGCSAAGGTARGDGLALGLIGLALWGARRRVR